VLIKGDKGKKGNDMLMKRDTMGVSS